MMMTSLLDQIRSVIRSVVTQTSHMPLFLQVLQRAIDAGIDLIVAFTTDFEKGDQIMKVARDNSGECCLTAQQ